MFPPKPPELSKWEQGFASGWLFAHPENYPTRAAELEAALSWAKELCPAETSEEKLAKTLVKDKILIHNLLKQDGDELLDAGASAFAEHRFDLAKQIREQAEEGI